MIPTKSWRGLQFRPGVGGLQGPGALFVRWLAAGTTPPSTPQSLFLRWLWVAYLPLWLLAASVLLALGGVFPWWSLPALAPLLLWGGLAVRLLRERRRQGLKVPVPNSLGIRIAFLAAVTIAGAGLVVIGTARLPSAETLPLLLLGMLALLAALLTPAVKMADLTLRAGRRWLDEHQPPRASI